MPTSGHDRSRAGVYVAAASVALLVAAGFWLTRPASPSAWAARPGLLFRADGDERTDPSRLSAAVEGFVRRSQAAPLPGIAIEYPLDGSLFPPAFAPPTLPGATRIRRRMCG